MAAYEQPLLHYAQFAAADLSAKQYFACKLNGSGSIALCSVAGEGVHGILQNKPDATDEIASIMTAGVSIVSCGGTVSEGDRVMTDASGELIVATGGKFSIGVMLADGVDGDQQPMFIQPMLIPQFIWEFPVDLADIADGDVVTTITPGFKGVIEKLEFLVSTPVTTASKLTSLNAEIGTTNLTGGVIALTSANCTPQGAVIAGTAVTAANAFTATDTVSIEASSTTAFVEGSGSIRVYGRITS